MSGSLGSHEVTGPKPLTAAELDEYRNALKGQPWREGNAAVWVEIARTMLATIDARDAEIAGWVDKYASLLEAAASIEAALRAAREGVARYVNAQGRHLYESWRDHLIECCDLERTKSGPHDAVRSRAP